jgi:hypothetical protein
MRQAATSWSFLLEGLPFLAIGLLIISILPAAAAIVELFHTVQTPLEGWFPFMMPIGVIIFSIAAGIIFCIVRARVETT